MQERTLVSLDESYEAIAVAVLIYVTVQRNHLICKLEALIQALILRCALQLLKAQAFKIGSNEVPLYI